MTRLGYTWWEGPVTYPVTAAGYREMQESEPMSTAATSLKGRVGVLEDLGNGGQ
jgi:hypothetical protein